LVGLFASNHTAHVWSWVGVITFRAFLSKRANCQSGLHAYERNAAIQPSTMIVAMDWDFMWCGRAA